MLNQVVLIGRLVRDPELKKTPNGTEVATFTLAVDNLPSANGEKTTSFISCQAWKNQANNIIKFCKKASKVAITGRLSQRQYQKKDGSSVSITEVIVSGIEFLEPKEKEEHKSATSNYIDPADTF